MSLKARVDKLYSNKISDVTACLIVKQGKKQIKKKVIGSNKNKAVFLVLDL